MNPNAEFLPVSRKHIFTAAHCIENKNKTRTNTEECWVLLGISDIVAEFLQSRNRKITEFVIHPDWNLTVRSWKADIAIGILEKMVKYNDFYGPICLNKNPIDEFYDRQGIVTGWGSTNVNGSGYSEIGNEFRLTIVDDYVCKEKTPGLVALAEGKSFCAGNISRSAACNGENEKKI